MFPAQQVDLAFSSRCDELIRRAWLLLSINTITATANDNTIPTMPANFRPDRLKQAYLTGSNVIVNTGSMEGYSPYYSIGAPLIPWDRYQTANLRLAPYIEVLNKTLAYQNSGGGSITGQPTDIAFDQISGSGLFFPTPDQNYSCTIRWNQLFTTWSFGTQGAWSSAIQYYVGDVVSNGGHTYQAILPSLNVAVGTASTWTDLGVSTITAPASVTFNLPDDYLLPVIQKGVRATLLQVDKDNANLAATALKEWNDYLVEMESKGDLGENFVTQTPSYSGGDGGWSGIGGGLLP